MSSSFVRTWLRRVELDSTSDLARQVVLDTSVECPLVVIAACQTNGRGRGQNTWWSDEGSLTFTLAIDPAAHDLRTEHEPRLALAAAVAIIDAVSPWLHPHAGGIRWPNDVEVDGRKLAGLLPERVQTESGLRLLIGIGLNVTTQLARAPDEVQRLATTLAALASRPLPDDLSERVLDAILAELPGTLRRLAEHDRDLAGRWAELDTLRGSDLRVELGNRIIRGRACGIDPTGALWLDSDEGRLQLYGGRILRDL